MPEPEVKDAQNQQVQDTPPKPDAAQGDDPVKKVEQKLSSWVGRLEAQQKKDREAFLAKFEEVVSSIPRTPTDTSKPNGGMKELNEKWAERILQGDVANVLDEALTLRREAEETIAKRNRDQFEKVLSSMEERKVPFFSDVKDDVRKVSESLMGQGYSPQDAVAFAYEKSRADHLMKMMGQGGFDPASLETSGGGSIHEDAGAKKGKLNSEGKKAWEKNKPYFKDESEFIAAMAPKVRARFVG